MSSWKIENENEKYKMLDKHISINFLPMTREERSCVSKSQGALFKNIVCDNAVLTLTNNRYSFHILLHPDYQLIHQH